MTIHRRNRAALSVALGMLLGCLGFACQGKVGERCDKFFQNQCADGTCIDTPDGAVCASTCSAIDKECPDGLSCVTVGVEVSGKGTLPAGYYCLPDEMPE